MRRPFTGAIDLVATNRRANQQYPACLYHSLVKHVEAIKKATVAAAQVSSPAVVGAAKTALAGGTDDDFRVFATSGYPTAVDQDNQALLRQWWATDPNEDVRFDSGMYANAAPEVIDWFINDEVKTVRLPDLIDTTWKLRETQGDNTRAAADAALRDGRYDTLDDFVNGGGYDKARYSDQLQQAYHLVKVVARRSKPQLKPPLPGTGRPSTSSSPSSSIAAACSAANAMPTTPKLIPSSNWETKPPMTPRNKPRPHRRPTSRQTEQPTGPMNTPAKHGNGPGGQNNPPNKRKPTSTPPSNHSTSPSNNSNAATRQPRPPKPTQPRRPVTPTRRPRTPPPPAPPRPTPPLQRPRPANPPTPPARMPPQLARQPTTLTPQRGNSN